MAWNGWNHPSPTHIPSTQVAPGVVERSLTATAQHLGVDGPRYRRLMQPLLDHGDDLVSSLLAPLRMPPPHPLVMARFGVNGIRSITGLARRFDTDEARGVLAGLAAHSMLSLRAPITSGFAMFLGVLAHHVGWPMARGGSQAIADALASLVRERGGEIVCDHRVDNLTDLPPSRFVLLDISPARFLDLAGDRLPPSYRRRLGRFRSGPGVFKIDWALDGPIPWTNEHVQRAGTVHLGGTFEEIAAAEAEVHAGRHPDRPYVLLAQQSQFDATRAPAGRHTAWAYCHVPNGSTVDRTAAIESQIERFAPGFRDLVAARHTIDAPAMEAYNANYLGGDITGGLTDLRQFVARPTLSLHPWSTPIEGVYLCSASTPPGPGVHGMSGRAAAELAMARTGFTPPGVSRR